MVAIRTSDLHDTCVGRYRCTNLLGEIVLRREAYNCVTPGQLIAVASSKSFHKVVNPTRGRPVSMANLNNVCALFGFSRFENVGSWLVTGSKGP
jgi:hypothetical protein